MDTTSVSLLHRLQKTREPRAWEQFVQLYVPLIYHWAKNHGFSHADRNEVVQEVLIVMAKKLPQFEYDPNLRFRGWLRTITVNKANDLHRKKSREVLTQGDAELSGISVDPESDLFEEKNYREFLIHQARKLMESEFEPTTWRACWLHVTEKRSAEDIGRELGISANAVRVAKSRVMRRLREELAGLLD